MLQSSLLLQLEKFLLLHSCLLFFYLLLKQFLFLDSFLLLLLHNSLIRIILSGLSPLLQELLFIWGVFTIWLLFLEHFVAGLVLRVGLVAQVLAGINIHWLVYPSLSVSTTAFLLISPLAFLIFQLYLRLCMFLLLMSFLLSVFLVHLLLLCLCLRCTLDKLSCIFVELERGFGSSSL
jgi:hypothetical protein